MYSKDSLELLRQKIDLLEVLSPYVDFKRSGASYKARCPFHEEKTPSFILQRGDSHYHCFGCGAHGDAIAFLMGHLKMSFQEAIEMLSEKFNVPLEDVKAPSSLEPSKALLRQTLFEACRFYHFYLLHTLEGQEALKYLYERGLDLEFIRMFQVGLSPQDPHLMLDVLKEKKISEQLLLKTGLITKSSAGHKKKVFFFDRIMFPIKDSFNHVVGFSARKYKQQTFGPKYINTLETTLFKKSEVLFGLSECRRRIAKERKAIIVEGQIDALRLIQAGFNLAVAGGGTAFTGKHIRQLVQLGVSHVYLAFDGDEAGSQAAIKVGDLFQQEGIETFVCEFEKGMDPDKWLQEKGPQAFAQLLASSIDYLTFLVAKSSETLNLNSPSEKNYLVQSLASRIKSWKHPLMVYESLKKVASLMKIPQSLLTEDKSPYIAASVAKESKILSRTNIDPQRIIEADVLRWFLLSHEKNHKLICQALEIVQEKHFLTQVGKNLYLAFSKRFQEGLSLDCFSLGIELFDEDHQRFLSEILQKKINITKVYEGLSESIKKLLDSYWFKEREQIKIKIQSGECSEEEVLELVKKFDELKKTPPQVELSCD